MPKLRPSAWHLAAVAGALAFVALLAWTASASPVARDPQLIFFLALLIMTELPALWWRRRGGGPSGTFLAALLLPLLLSEAVLGWSARRGDLRGIEQVMMVVVLFPILATGAIVSAVDMLLIEPDDGYQ
jgi:hypothetical protein